MKASTHHYLARFISICLASLFCLNFVTPVSAQELRLVAAVVPDELGNVPLPQKDPASPKASSPTVLFPGTITLPTAPTAPIPPTAPSITIPTITLPSIDSQEIIIPDPQSDIQPPKEIPDLKLTPSEQSPEIQIQKPQIPVLPPPSTPIEPQTPQTPETPQITIVPTPVIPSFSLEDFLITTDPTHQKPLEVVEPEEKLAIKPLPVEPEEKLAIKPLPVEPPIEKPEPPEPQKGDPMRIPEDAKETGNLDFLEGCWIGTRPEYHSKRIITERFCFDTNGIGKRTILDPTEAGTCIGGTQATMTSAGALQFSSEEGRCTGGQTWGSAEMLCEGEGDETPCSWVFSGSSSMKQSYSISFVRE